MSLQRPRQRTHRQLESGEKVGQSFEFTRLQSENSYQSTHLLSKMNHHISILGTQYVHSTLAGDVCRKSSMSPSLPCYAVYVTFQAARQAKKLAREPPTKNMQLLLTVANNTTAAFF